MRTIRSKRISIYGFAIALIVTLISPLSGNQIYSANAVQPTFALNYSAGPGGTITGATSQTVQKNGDGTVVTAVANTGYSFTSWSDGVTTATRQEIKVQADLNVTANFAIETFSISASVSGGFGSISPTSSTANYGSSKTITLTPDPNYEVATLTDNSVDVFGSIVSNTYTLNNITSNHVIVVTYKDPPVTYTLTYTAGTGGSISGTTPQTVQKNADGSAVTAVADPGYHFVDWSDSSVQNPRTDLNVTADISVTANFAVNATHTVTFDGNGGNSCATPQSDNKSAALASNICTRAGYSFTGWNTVAGGGGTAYADGATYDFSADITLYAQWAPINHTVTFDSNGGSGSMSVQTTNLPAALDLNSFTRAGYSFTGWNTVAGGGGTAYADGATYDFSADATLYAQWSALPTYTVTFNGNGGNSCASPQSDNKSAALTSNICTRSGFSFTGWNTVADGSGTAYADGATFDFSADVTLFAQWSVFNHTVTFHGNGSDGGSMSAQVTNLPATLTLNSFTNTGNDFAGWNTASDGSGTAYADGASFNFATDLDLYAQWVPMGSHTVTFNSNGGSGTLTPQATNVPTALKSNTFTNGGFTFNGWNTLADGTGTAYANGATYDFSADVTLYAQWISTTVNIAAINGVGVPVTGFIPTSSIVESSQYIGTITWSSNPSVFAPMTAYTATITLTAKTGYTLLGVASNFFTVLGATTVTNSIDSGVVTALFPTTGSLINTSSVLAVGDVNPTIVITGTGFKVGDLSGDVTIDLNGSGVTVASVTGNSATQMTVQLTGTLSAGYITVQAKTSAYNPVAGSPSNAIFLGFAGSDSSAGSSVSIAIPLDGTTLNISATLPINLKTGQSVSLSIGMSNDSTANYPVISITEAHNITNFDKPFEVVMPDLTGLALIVHSISGGKFVTIPALSSVPDSSFCSNPDNDGYFDNGTTITIYSCHISSYGYREDQATVTLSAASSTVTVGSTVQLTAGGGSGVIAYTYATSTGSICSVNSSGLVSTLAAGTCLVTATNPANNAYVDKTSSAVSITVNSVPSGGGGGGGVVNTGNVATTYVNQPSVTIASAELIVQLTKTTKLTVSGGAGSGLVTYATTTPDICSVASDGVVTGLLAGTCNVTVTKAASGSYLATSSNISITISDSEKKAADELAAKIEAEKLAEKIAAMQAEAAAKAMADAAASAAIKAEADRLALIAAQAEQARLAILNRNQITWKKTGKIYRVNINLAQKYAWELVTVKLGTKVKGKVVYKTIDWLALNGGGDGVITQSKAPVKGSYYRIVLGNKVVYTQLIK